MKLNEEKIKIKTHYSTMHYEHLKRNLANYESDAEKEYRSNEFLCKTCFYLKSGVAGDAFTRYACKNCGNENYHANTNVPRYCRECAKTHNCCVRCAAEL